jgi:hypothetical protein
MEGFYGACRRKRAPLGEYLVNAGVVTASNLRLALLEHTGESLRVLCVPGARAEWSPRRPGAYSSRFTFKTTELVGRAGAQRHRALAELVAAELAETFLHPEWGAAFVRSLESAAPEPIATHGGLPDKVAALIRLGRWASSCLDVAAPIHGDSPLVAAVLEDGAVVAWRSGPAILAGKMNSCGPARLLNRRARARRKDLSHDPL